MCEQLLYNYEYKGVETFVLQITLNNDTHVVKHLGNVANYDLKNHINP